MNISHSKYLEKYLFPFLLLSLMFNFLFAKSEGTSNLGDISIEENKLDEFYSDNSIPYSEYDKAESQLKLFFGYNFDPPNNSYYPDGKDGDHLNGLGFTCSIGYESGANSLSLGVDYQVADGTTTSGGSVTDNLTYNGFTVLLSGSSSI